MHLSLSQMTQDELAEIVLTASRSLIAIAARSLAGEEISLPQYRALVILAAKGEMNLVELAEELSVNPSSATRLCDRLYAKRLILKVHDESDRRSVKLNLSDQGKSLIDAVTLRRRAEVKRIVALVSQNDQEHLILGLAALSNATGEVADADWALQW